MARQPRRDTSASSFLKAAWGYATAFHLVHGSWIAAGSRDATFFAAQNLLGFAIELYLKAYLRGRGWTVDTLAESQYAHRLNNLLTAATDAGLFDYPGLGYVDRTAIKRVVDLIGPRFADYSYRYLDDQDQDYTNITNSQILRPVLDDLQARIEQSGVMP